MTGFHTLSGVAASAKVVGLFGMELAESASQPTPLAAKGAE